MTIEDPGPDSGPPAQDGDARFAARARAVLRDSAEQLDGSTRSRLTRARHAALEELARPGAGVPWSRWLAPAGGLAAAVLVAMVWFGGAEPGGPAAEPRPVVAATGPEGEDLVLIADAEQLELLEDIEFYAWLEDEADLSAPTAGGIG